MLIMKNQKISKKTNKITKKIFEKINIAKDKQVNISRNMDRRWKIVIIIKFFRKILDEIAYFFGYFTARKTHEIVNKYLKISKSYSQNDVNSITGNQLRSILRNERHSKSKNKIKLKDILKENGYSLEISNCIFNKSNLFLRVDLEDITFSECKFDLCHFSNSSLNKVTFDSCKLYNTSFYDSKIDTCNFHNCKTREVMFVGAKIASTCFTLCSMIGCSFEDAEINGCTFINSSLPATHFLEASVKDGSFQKCNLKDTLFFDSFSSFSVDEDSIKTAKVTRQTTAMIVDPDKRGVTSPKVYMKIDQVTNNIPIRISHRSPKIQFEKVNSEIKQALKTIGSYERNHLPIPQQLIEIIKNNPKKYSESLKILKKVEKLAAQVDSFFLPGGEDVPPALYGQQEEEQTEWSNDYRGSILELSIIHQSFHKGIPLMAVCRGFQMVNIYFGAQLIQHVKGHKGIQKFKLKKRSHKGLYYNALKNTFKSAVYHHQGVLEHKGPSDHLESAVIYDNLIKASELKYTGSVPMILLQFHPEFHKATTAHNLRREFVDFWLQINMSNNNESIWPILHDSSESYHVKKATLSDILKATTLIRNVEKLNSCIGPIPNTLLPKKLNDRKVKIDKIEKDREIRFRVNQKILVEEKA